MFKIGEFSRLSQVSIQTLRYYDELGLLKPDRTDRFTGYRYYTLDLLPRLNRILALKALGLSLEEIGVLLARDVPVAEMQALLQAKQAALEAEVDAAQARLAFVRARLQMLEADERLSGQDVVLKPVAPLRVLSIRQIIPTWESVPFYFGEVTETVIANGFTSAGPWLALYHDDAWVDADIDMEIALPVSPSFDDAYEMSDCRALLVSELPGVETAASLIHRGPYETKGQSLVAIGRWIAANGMQIAGPVREVYLRGPMDTDHPDELLTEIQFPLLRR
jgi:DNA-binding transcriptional MerR regulator/effector-binding domain-containing protein